MNQPFRSYALGTLLFTCCAQAQFGAGQRFGSDSLPNFDLLTDWDSDGDQDLVVVWDDSLGVWDNSDNAGTLVLLPRTMRTGFVRAHGDMDADGDQDLLLQDLQQGTLTGLRNNGGVLAPMAFVLEPSKTVKTAFADMDGDGANELLVLDPYLDTPSRVWMARNLNGTGDFGPLELIHEHATEVLSFLVMDLDTDGDNDVLLGAQIPDELVGLMNQDGAGNFGPATLIAAFPGFTYLPQDLNALDMDGDGDQDILAGATFGDLAWSRNLGDGQWSAIIDLPLSGPGNTTAHTTTVVDMEGDGDMDIIARFTVNAGFTFWLEHLSGEQFAQHTIGSAGLGAAAHPGDLDGDGVQELLSRGVELTTLRYDAGTFTLMQRLTRTPWGLRSAVVADMNGDGMTDIVAAAVDNGKVVWYERLSADLKPAREHIIDHGAEGASTVRVLDADADGDRDVIAVHGTTGQAVLYLNENAQGTQWSTSVLATFVGGIADLEVADLDGDGDDDVLLASTADGKVFSLTNNGGVFSGEMEVADTDMVPTDIAVADLNADGLPDLLIAGSGGSSGRVFRSLNLGGGGFGAPVAVVGDGPDAWCVDAVDVDGNGTVDLLVGQHDDTTSRLGWWMNTDGQGTFAAGTVVSEAHAGFLAACAADLDGDGDLDVATGNGTAYGLEGIVWFDNDGSGQFLGPHPTGPNYSMAGAMVPSDVDQDGDIDLVIVHETMQSGCIMENHAASPYRVSGTVFFDADLSGDHSPGDEPFPLVAVSSDPFVSQPFTAPDGSFTFFLDTGAYTITAPFLEPWWQTTTDSVYSGVLSVNDPVHADRDFGFAGIQDTTVVLWNLVSPGICAEQAPVWLHLYNVGATRPSGQAIVRLDTGYTFVNAVPAPDQIVDGDLYFSWPELGFFEHLGITINVLTPLTIDTAAIRTDQVWVTTQVGSDPPITSGDTLVGDWACSFDPNYLDVRPEGIGEQGFIPVGTAPLIYTVHFQNTGTAPAQNVRIEDQLPASLDVARIRILGATHPVSAAVEADRTLIFRFDGIQLPDSSTDLLGSQGHVLFAVDPAGDPMDSDVITNTAAIYFDYNAPVITNTVMNTFFDCSLFTAQITPGGTDSLQATAGATYQWYLDGAALPGQNGQFCAIQGAGAYTVLVTTALDCQAVSDAWVITGVPSAAASGPALRIMPNPVSGPGFVLLDAVTDPRSFLEVLDVVGHRVLSIPIAARHVVPFDPQPLAAGAYSIRLMTPNGVAGPAVKVLVR